MLFIFCKENERKFLPGNDDYAVSNFKTKFRIYSLHGIFQFNVLTGGQSTINRREFIFKPPRIYKE